MSEFTTEQLAQIAAMLQAQQAQSAPAPTQTTAAALALSQGSSVRENLAGATGGMDWALIAQAAAAGEDPMIMVERLKDKQRRQSAINNFGVMQVQLNKQMPIKQSKQTGRFYALGNLVTDGTEGVKIQGGRTLSQKHLAKLGRLEIDLGMSEGCMEMVMEHRKEVGGNHIFEFVLEGESQMTQLHARFPKNHEDSPNQNIYLIDAEQDATDPRNWTAEETATPLMKWQIRIMATGYLSTATAQIPGAALPEDDDAFDKMLEQAGKVSSVLSSKGLEAWRASRDAEKAAEGNTSQNPTIDMTASD